MDSSVTCGKKHPPNCTLSMRSNWCSREKNVSLLCDRYDSSSDAASRGPSRLPWLPWYAIRFSGRHDSNSTCSASDSGDTTGNRSLGRSASSSSTRCVAPSEHCVTCVAPASSVGCSRNAGPGPSCWQLLSPHTYTSPLPSSAAQQPPAACTLRTSPCSRDSTRTKLVFQRPSIFPLKYTSPSALSSTVCVAPAAACATLNSTGSRTSGDVSCADWKPSWPSALSPQPNLRLTPPRRTHTSPSAPTSTENPSPAQHAAIFGRPGSSVGTVTTPPSAPSVAPLGESAASPHWPLWFRPHANT